MTNAPEAATFAQFSLSETIGTGNRIEITFEVFDYVAGSARITVLGADATPDATGNGINTHIITTTDDRNQLIVDSTADGTTLKVRIVSVRLITNGTLTNFPASMEWTEVETGGPVVQMDLRNDLSVFPSSAGTATFARNGIATFRRGDALGQVAADQARFEDEGVLIEGESENPIIGFKYTLQGANQTAQLIQSRDPYNQDPLGSRYDCS